MLSEIFSSVTVQFSAKRTKKKETVCLLEQSYKNAEAHYFASLFINAGKLSIFNVCYQSH